MLIIWTQLKSKDKASICRLSLHEELEEVMADQRMVAAYLLHVLVFNDLGCECYCPSRQLALQAQNYEDLHGGASSPAQNFGRVLKISRNVSQLCIDIHFRDSLQQGMAVNRCDGMCDSTITTWWLTQDFPCFLGHFYRGPTFLALFDPDAPWAVAFFGRLRWSGVIYPCRFRFRLILLSTPVALQQPPWSLVLACRLF